MKRCSIFFNSRKRGMSEVIVTLLLVMLSIVLVGVIFVVAHNLLKTGSQEAATQAKCLASSVSIVSFSCTQTGSECNVTLKRTLGNDNIGGVRMVFSNDNGDSNSSDSPGNFITPSTKKVTAYNLGVANITQVSASIYFADSAGNIQPCPSSSAGLVGTSTGSGTSAAGGSSGGTTTNPSGSTTTTTSCTSDSDCLPNYQCVSGVCQCTPESASYFSSYCTDNSYQCGMVQVSNGTCGTTSLNCTAMTGGCSAVDYCDSNNQCQAPILLNNGTVDSAWPTGAPKFFNSLDLPKSQNESSLVAFGAYTQTGSPSYVRFPLSNDSNCEEIGYIQYQNTTNSSFVAMTFNSSDGYANITAGDQYRIWNTQAGCLNDTGTN